MQLEVQKLLYDIQKSGIKIFNFLDGKTYDNYVADDLLRSGVERQFEIIGEALNKLGKIDKQTVSRISDYKKIVAFRNILIHGYTDIDDRLVWNVVELKLTALVREVEALLSGSDTSGR